ncbi:CLIP domain-containing serine protease HP8-like isoform X2 [Nymphalis io]|uniref:CLIP domain-containing serine protease HP8-like isoform X2 n=1 Tax=Inachis io TaxID=171585 RepID=UPI00216A607C|nr:CLIP domain-containing serine protease HP8-like isoform X2 [Nymphalis io]
MYCGESCFAGNQAGSCKRLSDCPSLIKEIKRAGNPMPNYIRKKLQNLGCGFDYDDPLICCSSCSNNDDSEQGDQPNNNRNPWSTSKPIDQSGEEFIKPSYNFGGEDDDNKRGSDSNESNKPIPDIQYHRNIDLLPNNCGPIEGERVFGGNRTRLFEMPWMVLLSYDSARGTRLSCGGTLITQWYVLTAAHCVSFLGSRLELRQVILGEYDTRKDPDCERNEGQQFCAPNVRNVGINNVIAHPGYTPKTLRDDIALIRLAEPADFSLDSMKPICLPKTPELLSEKLEGLQGVVAGWGATENGLQSPVLLSVDLPIITNTECQNIYNGSPQIYETQLCAGGVPDKDSCGGDSGGPLIYPGRNGGVGVRYIQRGIVSYGSKRCGIGGYPGVYTRVVNYMNWILDNISD